MKTFALVHRNVCLNVICDDEFENVIKEHFCKSTKLIFEKHPSCYHAEGDILLIINRLKRERYP